MSQIIDERCGPGETAWEGFSDDQIILQRACPDCDRGLLHTPARLCAVCGGTGVLTRTLPASAPR